MELILSTLDSQQTDRYLASLSLIDPDSNKPSARREIIQRYSQTFPAVTPPRLFPIDLNTTYIWSDQHFGHERIIEYSKRPFKTVTQMDQHMLAAYNQLPDKSTVIWLGDIAWNNAWMRQCLFRKHTNILIPGNHDMNIRDGGWRVDVSKFDVFELGLEFTTSKDDVTTRYVLTHYPMRTMLPPNTINIHGHTHTNLCGPNHINVSVEQQQYNPIRLFDLINK